jgi:hypothetical protein
LNVANERIIKDLQTNKTQISQRVLPLVKYNIDTGEVENFGTWEQEQTYQALTTHELGIVVPQGQSIKFDTDLDSDLRCNADDDLRLRTGGSDRMKVSNVSTLFYKALICSLQINLKEIATPTNVSGYVNLYAKASGGTNKLYYQNDAGTEFEIAVV